jgi:hypothetical protein
MKKFLFLFFLLAFPTFAFAATVTTNNLEAIIAIIIDIFNNYVNRIVVAVAVLGFVWGLAMFIWSAGNEKKRAEGKYIMLWGVIALFVIVSIVGLIKLLQVTFDIHNDVIPIPSANSADYNIGQ